MIRPWVKWLLFLSSYLPLFVIMLIQDFDSTGGKFPFKHQGFSAILMIIGLTTIVVLLVLLKKRSKRAGRPMNVKSFTAKDIDSLQYAVVYVIPFLSMDFGDTKDFLSLTVMLVVVGLLYVNSDMIYVNPILNMMGYRFYEVFDEKRDSVTVLTKQKMVKEESVLKLVPLYGDL